MSVSSALTHTADRLALWGATISGAVGRRRAAFTSRRLHAERLETRAVLSATISNALLPPDVEPAPDVPQQAPPTLESPTPAVLQAVDPLEITAVHLRAGDTTAYVTSSNQTVQVPHGAQLEVVGIEFALNPNGAGLPGAVAFEGYLRKIPTHGGHGRGRFDYGDGRFGAVGTRDPLTVGSHAHGGLEGGWSMQPGWDRLAVAMVRYSGAEVDVAARFFVNIEVQQPDFVVTEARLSRGAPGKELPAGEETRIQGQWDNVGAGTYHNYAEVDIYHHSDPTRPVWVGTLAGTARPGRVVKGEYVNRNDADEYTPRWTPQVDGTYILKFYADPEDVWEEASEANNVLSLEVSVAAGCGRDAAPRDSGAGSTWNAEDPSDYQDRQGSPDTPSDAPLPADLVATAADRGSDSTLGEGPGSRPTAPPDRIGDSPSGDPQMAPRIVDQLMTTWPLSAESNWSD